MLGDPRFSNRSLSAVAPMVPPIPAQVATYIPAPEVPSIPESEASSNIAAPAPPSIQAPEAS
jgi:hypothetical protein